MRICWGLPGSVWKSRWSFKQYSDITGNLYTYIFPILLQNKQKPITNSCKNNLWSKLTVILSKTQFKILTKKPGDEAFQVSFKFPRRGWDQRLADFMELLLLFSITTPWYNQTKNLVELIPIFANLIENRRTIKSQINSYPSKIYLFKFKNRNNRKRYKICPKLTIKTRQWFRYGVFIDDLEHILHLFSVFFLFFDFEQVDVRLAHTKNL